MKRDLVLKALVVICGVALGVAAVTLSPERERRRSLTLKDTSDATDLNLRKLASYKSWTLVNSNPFLMQPASAALCAAAMTTAPSPHDQKWVSVFVNPAGADAMMKQLKPTFPEGTMIVKEKHATAQDSTPELLTAMIKRTKGFYPDGGDWEYFVLDGAASKIVSAGKQESCRGCHVLAKNTDYVLRSYLPTEVQSKLH